MTRRILIAIFLLALLTSVLSGCDQQATEPDATSSLTVPAQQTEDLIVPEGTWGCLLPEKAAPHDSCETWVISAISKTYEWDDGAGNRNRVTIHLPHINTGRNCAAAFNAAIDDFAAEIIAQVEECAEGAYSTHITSVDYEAYCNGDTLSILIITGTSTDYVEYDVYNFDTEDEEAMTIADMCNEYLDMEYPVFLKYTLDRIWSDFEGEYPDFIAQFPEEHDFISHLYLSDLSVLCNYRLYLDESGHLILVADQPSMAGAAYYASLAEMKINPTLIPAEKDAWNWLFDLYLDADPDNIEYARQLLIAAFEEDRDDYMEFLRNRTPGEQAILEAAASEKYNSKG